MKCHFYKSIIPIVLLSLSSGCQTNDFNTLENTKNTTSSNNISTIIKGKVDFTQNKFSIKATTADIGIKSVVSLIYPYDHPSSPNVTIATGLSDSNGAFLINPDSGFSPVKDFVYVLEASKRIGDYGNEKLSLRTFIKWNGSSWQSITSNGIFINSFTTALSVLSSSKSIPSINTIGRINNSGNSSIPLEVFRNGEKILFTSAYEICTINPDGSGFVNLTNNVALDSSPVFSPDGSKIAFVSQRGGNFQVYIMNDDGSNVTKITNNIGSITDFVAFSPDGKKLAFSSNHDGDSEIYVINTDGTNQVKLTNNTYTDNAPWFSPDGSKIVFSTIRDGNYEIYTMNSSDGSNPVRLTTNASFEDSTPSFSNDGSKITFFSNRTGNYEIFKMNSDGTNQTQLTNNTISDYSSAFNSNDSKIAFLSDRGGNNQIYIMNSDGTNQTQLTNIAAANFQPRFSPSVISSSEISNLNDKIISLLSGNKDPLANLNIRKGKIDIVTPSLPKVFLNKIFIYGDNGSVFDPKRGFYSMNPDGSILTSLTISASNFCISPDGKIFYSRAYITGEPYNDQEIFVMNSDGSSNTVLTNDSIDQVLLDISPDGKKILFFNGQSGTLFGGAFDLYLYDIATKEVSNINFDSYNESYGRFSPDGSKIFFTSSRGSGIYSMNLDGSNIVQIKNTGTYFNFSPDGKKIVYIDSGNIFIMNVDGSGSANLTNINSGNLKEPTFSPDGKKILFGKDNDGYTMNADGTNVIKIYDHFSVLDHHAYIKGVWR